MAKDIKQSLKVSTETILSTETNINDKLEGIANLKSAASVFNRRTNHAVGVTVDTVKTVPMEDRIFLKEYENEGKAMIEKTIIDSSVSMNRTFSKDQMIYVDAAKMFLQRNVSTDFFIYVGQSDKNNPLFELVHVDVNDKMYKRTKDNPNPPKAVSSLLKPRINREDIQRLLFDGNLPLSLQALVGDEVVTKRTTRIVKKDKKVKP